MIPSFPFFRPQMYFNPYKYNHYNGFNNNFVNTPNSKASHNLNYGDSFKQNEYKKEGSVFNSSEPSNDEYFEIFGIHLFFDDILILCLLFFLYEENVNDQLLFVALLLLLMS